MGGPEFPHTTEMSTFYFLNNSVKN